MTRRGFTLIELFMVVIILVILSSVGLFKYIDLRRQAVAAKVASDMQSVKLAALTAWTDSETWPPESGPGIEPIEIRNHLTGSVTFVNPTWTLDWDNLTGGGGGGGGGYLIGISVTTTDPQLMVHLQRTLGTTYPYLYVGGRLTYILVGPSGIF